MKTAVNVLIYQFIWFLCVLGGNRGALYALPLLVLHLLISHTRRADLMMMAILLGVGILVDGTLQYVGFFTFSSPGFPIPFWLMMIWLGLAITPHHSLSWMKKRPILCALFGAVGGPAAYWAGVRLGAASFTWPLLQALLSLALVWSLLWTTVMHLSVVAAPDYLREAADREHEK